MLDDTNSGIYQFIFERFNCSQTEQRKGQDELIYSQALMDGILCAHMREGIGWP